MTRLNSHGAAVCSILLQFFSSRQIGVTHVTWWLAWHSKEVFGPQVQRLIQSQGAFQRSSSRLNHNVKVILGLVWVTIQSISRCWDWKKAANKYWPRQLLITRKISLKSVFNEHCSSKWFANASDHIVDLYACQGGRTWQPFVGSKNGNENFRQARIYNFRVKCVFFGA